MATTPVVSEQFGGLNLADPQQIGMEQACDLLNVAVESDRLRTRPGYTALATLPSSDTPTAMAELQFSGAAQLVVAGAAKAYAYDNAGALITSVANGGSPLGSVVTLGSSTAVAAYIADPVSGIRKWNGAAFSLPVTSFNPKYLAVQALDNRLVAANGGSTNSRVWFSAAGSPESFDVSATGDWVDLTPGDGEVIGGLVTWRDQVFAFKQTKFFVFYGNSIGAGGRSVFNFRSEDATLGSGPTAAVSGQGPSQICAGRTGVYFIADDGVYRTTGDTPERVSRPLDYWFWRRPLPSCSTLTGLWDGDYTGASIVAFQDRVYCTLKASGTPTTFVLNETTGAWSVYRFTAFGVGIQAFAGCSFVDGNSSVRTLLLGFSNSVIGKHDETRTTDNGQTIDWKWSSGYGDFGAPSQVKVSLESRVWGSGSVALKVGNDYAAFDTGSTLTLGTAPAVLDAWQEIDREGTLWQHQLSGSGQAVVSRVTHYLSFTKPPGVQ